MGTAHVPVEIFCLEIEGKGISENRVQRAGNVLGGGTSKISRCAERSFASLSKLGCFSGIGVFHLRFGSCVTVEMIGFEANPYLFLGFVTCRLCELRNLVICWVLGVIKAEEESLWKIAIRIRRTGWPI